MKQFSKKFLPIFTLGFVLCVSLSFSHAQSKESLPKDRNVVEKVKERTTKVNAGGAKGAYVRLRSRDRASIGVRVEKASLPSMPNTRGRSGYGGGLMFRFEF